MYVHVFGSLYVVVTVNYVMLKSCCHHYQTLDVCSCIIIHVALWASLAFVNLI